MKDIQHLFEIQFLQYPKYRSDIGIQVEYKLKGDNIEAIKFFFNIRISNFIMSKKCQYKSRKNLSISIELQFRTKTKNKI